MRQLSRHGGAKAVAWLLLTLLLLADIAGGFGVGLLVAGGAYGDGGAYLTEAILRSYADHEMGRVMAYYDALGSENLTYYRSHFQPENSNLVFALTDADGVVLLDNGELAEASQYSVTRSVSVPEGTPYAVRRSFTSYEAQERFLSELQARSFVSDLDITPIVRYGLRASETTGGESGVTYFDTPEERDDWCADHNYAEMDYFEELLSVELYALCYQAQTLTLSGQIPVQLTAHDSLYYQLTLARQLVQYRLWLIGLLVLCALLTLAVLVFLCCGAGRRADTDEVCLSWFNRIPLELQLLFCAVVISLPAAALDVSGLAQLVLMAALMLPAGLALALQLTSIAALCKARCCWQRTLTCRLLTLLGRACRGLWHWMTYVLRGLPSVWQLLLAALLVTLAELWVLAVSQEIGVWLLFRLLWLPLLLVFGIQLSRLRQGAHRIAGGDLHTQVDLRYMRGDLRRHGEDLNNISSGLQSAVEEQIRSERLKTELITNVSHDIKTPLTSIVNYVDLLSREDIPEGPAREYLEVLRRQSARLRKLTEDLIEASKAATGNIEVHAEPMDVNVLLSQAAGEYEEKLRGLELEPVLTFGSETTEILADGRLLWRVFDNLMSNICKYALPGTRVYLSTAVAKGAVEITFRNISRYPLNITSSELMERFVRGDASRSTEGSGLGLSIAQSLTTLQGGDFDLTIDGDLFKAVLRFPALAQAGTE